MSGRNAKQTSRLRVGQVSVYLHHGSWWLYCRDDSGLHRKKVAPDRDQAAQIAARVSAQLAGDEPTLLTFSPISVYCGPHL